MNSEEYGESSQRASRFKIGNIPVLLSWEVLGSICTAIVCMYGVCIRDYKSL